jgi:hypothetical protein
MDIKQEEEELPTFSGSDTYVPPGFTPYEWNDLLNVFITLCYHS